MEFKRFKVTNYRNIIDSDWIDLSQITAFVGQNESGKSNLFEALYRVNPIITSEKYNFDEDWPVDKWGEKKNGQKENVCIAEFSLSEEEIADLYKFATPKSTSAEEEIKTSSPPPATHPLTLKIQGIRSYEGHTIFSLVGDAKDQLNETLFKQWAGKNVPKFVYIHDYEMTGTQVELQNLRTRWDEVGKENRHKLTNEDQTILIILDLAQIDLEDLIKKGTSPEGRTTRSFDKRAASAYLTKQFQKLWRQKEVKFDIDIDGTTLNILAEDEGLEMPVRLNKRSTGFRWYVSFAWKFTHASNGQYKDCILLLEEPGIHLHYDGQRDLLETFERLSDKNTILYSTHLASMVDLGNPERIRMVESHNHHCAVKTGVVSSQKGPMAIIEMRLGLTGDMSGLLGNRHTLITEGGDDTLILHKLSGIMRKANKSNLSDRVYLWPAEGAPKTPMYAAFAIGQKWDAGVLLDSDDGGNAAKKKIQELYLSKIAEEDQKRFRVLMLGDAAGIKKNDAAIEDIFPDEFYVECVNAAFGLAMRVEDLPQDGSDMITKRVEKFLQKNHGHKELDKRRVFKEMLKQFDQWNDISDLPNGTAERAEKLFSAMSRAFTGG